MRRSLAVTVAAVFAALLCVAGRADAAELTSTELRWLQGARPVLAFAKRVGLPLDVIVQPQDAPDAPPLALAFVDGRCKLVLSMRGNAEAQATLDRIEPALLDAAIELMTAHELGHCERHVDGAWNGLPPGFAARQPAGLSAELRAAYEEMQAARREEGFGDLVGLAWTQQQHADLYAALHAWLLAERSRDRVAGSPHDTLAWLRVAAHGIAPGAASIFAASADLWTRALPGDDE